MKKGEGGIRACDKKRNKWFLWPVLFLAIGVLASVALFFISCLCYQTFSPGVLIPEYEFGGLLAYAAACASAIATIVLACVSLWQTREIQDAQIKKDEENTKRPFFVLDGVLSANSRLPLAKAGEPNAYFLVDAGSFKLVLKNVGDGPANNYVPYYEWDGSGFNIAPEYLCVSAGGAIELTLHLNKNQINPIVEGDIIYENILGYQFAQHVLIEAQRDLLAHGTREGGDETEESGYRILVHPLGPQRALGAVLTTWNR